MFTLYLLLDRVTARMAHGKIRMESSDGTSRSVPLEGITHVVLDRRAHITMPLVFALLERGTTFSFVNGKGELVASMGGDILNKKRFRRQKENLNDKSVCCSLIRDLVSEKIRRQRWLVRRYAERNKSKALEKIDAKLSRCYAQSDDVPAKELRDLERRATKFYFSAFPKILDQNLWPWKGRSDSVASDPVNAILNLGYAFLEREVRIAIIGAHLSPGIGFFHTDDERKAPLVYDLMEIFYQNVIDSFVLRLLNCGVLSPEDVVYDEKTGCRLADRAFPVWSAAYEEYMIKPVQDFDGKTPRDIIRREIWDFAASLFGNLAS